MTNIIILWLMTSPGHWERTVHEYDDHQACHDAIEMLEERHPPEKPWRRWKEYLTEDFSDNALMFEDRC